MTQTNSCMHKVRTVRGEGVQQFDNTLDPKDSVIVGQNPHL